MMYRFLYLLITVLFLVGCGAKKRALRKTKKAEEVVTKKEKKSPAKEEFVVFNITSTEHYIETFKDVAKKNMIEYGIPASITLAQGILESGSGRGTLTRKTNNHFGIKCHRGWEGDRDYYDDDEKGECFRKYNHPMFSYRDHSLFLTSRSRYDFLFDLKKSNYKGWARGLKKAGYATDRKYPTKLISIIERYKLYQYDKEVLKDKWKPIKEIETPVVSSQTKKIHTVIKGDTLYSISRRYGLTVEKLMSINNLDNINISIGQKLIIKPSK
ncbi:LysM peptidoglycan-binding domain-containing protein [Flavobacteriaceae bacterium R38]|nr:LysM peptidoglycan-binding domain-containing protein [Flavobacteriaceae bacterium R38]